MKKFWKTALKLVTLATVVPVSITHDETTGKTTYQSLLASLEIGPTQNGVHTDVGLNLGEGVLTGAIYQRVAAQKESALYADSELIPSSAVKKDDSAPSPAEESTAEEAPL